MFPIGTLVKFKIAEEFHYNYSGWLKEMIKTNEYGVIIKNEYGKDWVRPLKENSICPYAKFSMPYGTMEKVKTYKNF